MSQDREDLKDALTETVAIRPESCRVLDECRELQLKKSRDYQSAASAVKQADHYPRGCDTVLDMAWQKMIRMYSLSAVVRDGGQPVNESLEDSAKDAINYLSFYVSYLRGKMSGQDGSRDMFNRPRKDAADNG